MTNVKIDVDVNGVDKTIEAIKRDLHRGMEKSVDNLVDNARDKARQVITENDAIFNAEVYKGFRDAETKNTGTSVRAKLYNDVDHAEVLEEGATFPAKGPPVEALLPWVARKMNVDSNFRSDAYNNAGIPDSFDGDGGDDDSDDGGGGSGETIFTNDTPLYGVKSESVNVQDEAYVQTATGQERVYVIEKYEDTFKGEDGLGNSEEYAYSDISTTRIQSPVSDRLGQFEAGDRVSFYDREDDAEIDVILTGESNIGGVESWEVLDADTKDPIGYVQESTFFKWRSAEPVDRDKITPEMREYPTRISSGEEATEELIYPNQEVVVYNPIEEETRSATINTSPWRDDLLAIDENGETVQIQGDYWDIVAGVDFNDLSETEQNARIEDHFDLYISINNADSDDRTYYKNRLTGEISQSFQDKDALARTIFSLTEINIEKGRAHASTNTQANDLGWELQMYPDPDGVSEINDKKFISTLVHEFGHGYSQPTVASTNQMQHDPIEYKFDSVWPDRSDLEYDHMFVDGLPKWEFGSNNPVHGFREMYMFNEGKPGSKVTYDSNDNLISDSRDELNPYGIEEWEDKITEIAKANAKGLSLAEERMDVTVKELTDKQIFGGGEISLEEGDLVALELDGEEVIHTFRERTGVERNFGENPDDEDVPQTAEAVKFETLSGDVNEIYISDEGEVYQSIYRMGNVYLTDEEDKFIGTASRNNYDPSLNEFPELTETDETKRLQEAANMAWWYQVKFIENDESRNKQNSSEILPGYGYSSTTAEEIMSMFTEVLGQETIIENEVENLEMFIEKYPYFVREVLNHRYPVSDEAEQLLKDEGFL